MRGYALAIGVWALGGALGGSFPLRPTRRFAVGVQVPVLNGWPTEKGAGKHLGNSQVLGRWRRGPFVDLGGSNSLIWNELGG